MIYVFLIYLKLIHVEKVNKNYLYNQKNETKPCIKYITHCIIDTVQRFPTCTLRNIIVFV